MMPKRFLRPAVRLVAAAITIVVLAACSRSTTIAVEPGIPGDDVATPSEATTGVATPDPTPSATVAPTPDDARSDEPPTTDPTPNAAAPDSNDSAAVEWPPGLATASVDLAATLPTFEVELDGTRRPRVQHPAIDGADDYVTYVASALNGTVVWAGSSDTPTLIVGGGTDVDNGGLGLQLTEPVIVVVHARTDGRPIAIGGPVLFDPQAAG